MLLAVQHVVAVSEKLVSAKPRNALERRVDVLDGATRPGDENALSRLLDRRGETEVGFRGPLARGDVTCLAECADHFAGR